MASILMMITKVSRFASDAAGLEKTLRLLQGISQITIASISPPKTVAPWLQARKQFALGRRYLRFFKFIDAFGAASSAWWSGGGGIGAVLQVGRWSCLGMYLLMESCTILDATEIHPTPWAPTLLLEAHRFWFYSLLFSLTFSLVQISQPPSAWPLLRQLLTDAFDILIPGSVTGWAQTSPAIVGAATVASTLLASQEIWDRVQRSAAASSSAAGSRTSASASIASSFGARRPEKRRRMRKQKEEVGEGGYELRDRRVR